MQDVNGHVVASRRRGIWVLPALLNHSCAPTCNIMWIDDAAFVRAAHDLEAGEQTTSTAWL